MESNQLIENIRGHYVIADVSLTTDEKVYQKHQVMNEVGIKIMLLSRKINRIKRNNNTYK